MLLLIPHTTSPMMMGTINTKTGHSGRLRSCSMTNNTAIANGISVRKSSTAPTILPNRISSAEVEKNIGKYHTWLKVMLAKRAAVHWRRRTGGVTSMAMALPWRSRR